MKANHIPITKMTSTFHKEHADVIRYVNELHKVPKYKTQEQFIASVNTLVTRAFKKCNKLICHNTYTKEEAERAITNVFTSVHKDFEVFFTWNTQEPDSLDYEVEMTIYFDAQVMDWIPEGDKFTVAYMNAGYLNCRPVEKPRSIYITFFNLDLDV